MIGRNRLFLTCPNGFMESRLRKSFGESSYFITAMAVIFNWDFNAQWDLIDLLERKRISEIYFVGNVANSIYMNLPNGSPAPSSMSWKAQLAEIYSNLTHKIESQPGSILKRSLLLADHLSSQISQMRDKCLLNEFIVNHDLRIEALVYDPHSVSYTSATEVNRRALVFKGVNYN